MTPASDPGGVRRVRRTYLALILSSTLAASLIWGVNTLFLLDAGLTNTQAFAANAFYTLGMVVFEIPTGVVADTRGRRMSFLLGAVTLLVATLGYVWLWDVGAPFWAWAAVSAWLGLGFTFFTGAVEAWLVDALTANGFTGELDSVFAQGAVVQGAAMLTGAVAGGFLAQAASLGAPYLARAGMLGVTVLIALALMRDEGFSPVSERAYGRSVRAVLRGSVEHGLANRPVRWVMLAAPFTMGVMVYAFYAMQPWLLELWGDESAFGIAGLAAAVVGGAQMVGGLAVPLLRRIFATRTGVLVATCVLGVAALTVIGRTRTFGVALVALVVWAVASAGATPVRQAYINGLVTSSQRATVLSFDALMGSAGGVVLQPSLGRAADLAGYGTSYVASAVAQAIALPFLVLARRERAVSDPVRAAGDR